jgi:hypothetical protein
MACSKVLLSNESSTSWVYFNFRRCSDGFFENQFGVPPLGQREINYENGSLISAFETGYQIDPDGFNTSGTSPEPPSPTTTTTTEELTTTTTTEEPTTTTTTEEPTTTTTTEP